MSRAPITFLHNPDLILLRLVVYSSTTGTRPIMC